MRPGDILASRYRLTVLLHDRNGGRFWRAHDLVLARDVALHLIAEDDPRSPLLQAAARRSATILDRRLLRVLDTDVVNGQSFVVNEWGEGTSLNNMVADEPLAPVRAAWIVAEVATMIAAGHRAGVAHGRLVPENVLLDTTGSVKVIGFAVDAALHGLPPGRVSADLTDLGGLLYTALTGRWTGVSESGVEAAPLEHGKPLRPRQVRAGVPRVLDGICESLLGSGARFATAEEVAAALHDYVGDPAVVASAEAERRRDEGAAPRQVTFPPFGSSPANPSPSNPAATVTADPASAVPASDLASASEAPADAEPTQAIALGDLADLAHEAETERTQVSGPLFGADPEDAALADPDWHAPSDVVPAPPPPFEEPPERPLFAPDPPEGRLRRLPPATSADAGSWPFGDTGSLPVAPVAAAAPAVDVPGRNWLRFAMILLAVLVILPVLYVVAGLLQDDGDPAGSGSDGPTPSETVVSELTATAFDPPPGDNEEHNGEAARAVDADKTSIWETSSYRQNLGPGGIKPGVGLVIDLGTSRAVTSVVVTVQGGTHTIELLATGDTAPTTTSGLTPVAQGEGSGEITLAPTEPVEARYLVVWLTSIPRVDGDFRGAVADVEVRA